MEKTGERYAAARRELLSQADSSRRHWHAPPEVSDQSVLDATGKGWDDWCDTIDAWPGHAEGHKAIAAYLQTTPGLDGWWAQTVTVGWERITGIRLPYQRADGTFTAGKSKTLSISSDALRTMLLDKDRRDDLFPDQKTMLKSKATAKAIRIAIGPGIAQFSLSDAGDGRTKVAIQHEKLSTFDDVEEWKFYWTDWLDALDEAANLDPA